MAVTIGGITFDRVDYDREADVLYLHVGDPSSAVEGHHVRFDAEGRLVGVTIVNARRILDEEGRITVTLPNQLTVEGDELEQALSAA